MSKDMQSKRGGNFRELVAAMRCGGAVARRGLRGVLFVVMVIFLIH